MGRRARVWSPRRIGAGATAGVFVGAVLVAGAGAVALAGPAPDGRGTGQLGSTPGPWARAAISTSAAARTVATAGSSSAPGSSLKEYAGASGGNRHAVPAMVRDASTRTPPREIAAGVTPGQSVRISTVKISADGASVTVLRRTGQDAATAAIAAAQADPAVVAVQVDQRVRALDDVPAPATDGPQTTGATRMTAQAALSNDAQRPDQWALDALRAEQAWDVTRGAGQVVAVVDSGVDGTHPDLAGQVLAGTDLVSPGGNGWNDGRGHGTHVAGIIAALAGNGIGIAGLAPAVKILPVRALDALGEGYDSDIAAGVIWAVSDDRSDHRASVINLSVGGSENSAAMRAAVSYAVGQGAVVVAAAGNECQAGDGADYPAAFGLPGELAVAATTSQGVSASYSNTGSYIQVAAPGDRIVSTYPKGEYAELSGTSMATPYAAAAVALIRAADPGLGPVDAARLLISTADDLGHPGRDDDTGAGLVDPVAALCSIGHCPTGAAAQLSPSASSTGLTPSPLPSAVLTPSTSIRSAAVTGMTATVRVPPAPTVIGKTARLAVTVTDGRCAVEGAHVTVATSDRAAQGSTGRDGVAQITVAAVRSAGWKVSVTAPGHATAHTAVAVSVVPAVSVRWTSSRAAVTVTPLRRQTVSLSEWTSGRWILRRRTVAGSGASGTVTLAVTRTGRARVTVSAAGGLAAVSVEHG
jgi:serine protease